MTFTCDDLDALVAAVAASWTAGAGRDWSVPAGTLEWTCAATADHAVDTVLAPAFFLASRKQDGYPPGEPFTVGDDPTAAQLVEALVTAARILRAVVETTPDDVTATIWPGEVRGRADFVPRAGLELALHAHDVCACLVIPFDPPREAIDHLRAHVAEWPFWSFAGWSPLTMSGDPWADLLRATGRNPGTGSAEPAP
jgi:hypothetical protein